MKRAILLAGWSQAPAGVALREYAVVPVPRQLIGRPLRAWQGSEYTLKGVVGRELVEEWGGKVVRLPHVRGWSSSGLIASIQGRKR
jgi:bifunctional ADP-heptose synthase (sugar kinase/adenylyltransferase)